MSTQQTQTSGFFDLLTSGVGLVSRIRDVTGKRKGATPSVYCTIAVPLDPKGTLNPRWTNFDVRVSQDDAINLINSFRDRVAAGQRPRIQFTIGDIYGHSWVRSLESGATEIRACFKGRLIRAQETDHDLGSLGLITRGIGYANVLQQVDSSHGLSIGALHGSKSDVQYEYFDSRANPLDDEAVSAIEQIRQIKADNKDAKVLISFELANVRTVGFHFAQSSKRAGELGASNAADLVRIRWIRVNGQPVALRSTASQEAQPDVMPIDDAAFDDDVPFED